MSRAAHIPGALALVTVLIHLLVSGRYEYFRDELYYIACSEHLAFGYVDHPPLSILLLAVSHRLLGDSLLAIRLLPALAAGALVLLTGWIARELGGGVFARTLAAIAVLAAPVFSGLTAFFSMNAFEPLFWALGAYLFIRIVNSGNQRLWLPFGVVAGLGVENKHSMLFFLFGLALGIVLSGPRRYLRSKWMWLGAAVALALVVPNIIWEIHHGWPTLEFMHNAQLYKNYHASLLEYAGGQVLVMNPLSLPVWLAGLCFYLFSEAGRRYRALGWTYVVVLALMVLQAGKVYYLAPVYPILLAPGAILVERFASRRPWRWVRPAYVALLAASGVALAPLTLPILPPQTLINYAGFLAVQGPREERHRRGILQQVFADMFGWPEMAAAVSGVYWSLPPQDRADCAIFAQNYGEAGAIDFFGRRYGLPHAICPLNNYWLWGYGNSNGRVTIVIGGRYDELRRNCQELTRAAVVRCEYCMPYENNLPIYVCRGLKRPLSELWAQVKVFD